MKKIVLILMILATGALGGFLLGRWHVAPADRLRARSVMVGTGLDESINVQRCDLSQIDPARWQIEFTHVSNGVLDVLRVVPLPAGDSWSPSTWALVEVGAEDSSFLLCTKDTHAPDGEFSLWRKYTSTFRLWGAARECDIGLPPSGCLAAAIQIKPMEMYKAETGAGLHLFADDLQAYVNATKEHPGLEYFLCRIIPNKTTGGDVQ